MDIFLPGITKDMMIRSKWVTLFTDDKDPEVFRKVVEAQRALGVNVPVTIEHSDHDGKPIITAHWSYADGTAVTLHGARVVSKWIREQAEAAKRVNVDGWEYAGSEIPF